MIHTNTSSTQYHIHVYCCTYRLAFRDLQPPIYLCFMFRSFAFTQSLYIHLSNALNTIIIQILYSLHQLLQRTASNYLTKKTGLIFIHLRIFITKLSKLILNALKSRAAVQSVSETRIDDPVKGVNIYIDN